MKQRFILIASVIVGLVAALLTRQYLNAKDREVAKQLAKIKADFRTISVIGVNRVVASGTVLTTSDLCAFPIVENAVRGHVVEEKDYTSLLGRRLIRTLEKESPIYWSDIEGGDRANRGLAGDIKSRMRAISITVGGAAAVSGMVRPSDHVDVLGTFSFPSPAKPNEMEMVTLTVLQDVLVLATGRDTAKTQLAAPDRNAGGYSTVTIEVTPREAEMLVFAEQARGRLVLTLRNPDDIYYERDLPRVDFTKIQDEITNLNLFRQETLLRKVNR